MDALVVLLLESWLKLLIAELVIGLVLLAVCRRLARVPRWLLPGALFVGVGRFVLQALVETPAEHMRRVVRTVARAVDFGQLDVVSTHLSPRFAAWGYDRNGALEYVRAQLDHYRVDEVRVSAFRIEREGDRAVVEFRGRARVSSEQSPVYPYLARWRVEMVREDNAWRITSADEVAGPGGATPAPRVRRALRAE